MNSFSVARAYGPRSEAVVDQTTIQDLLERTRDLRSSHRGAALRKWQIFTHRHKPLIQGAIYGSFDDKQTRADLTRFISTFINPAREVTRETSVVYKQGARRKIVGVAEEKQRAYEEMVRESDLDLHAAEWNQIASFIGPVIAIPVVQLKGKMSYDVLLPHMYDAAVDPDDPFGPPLAVAWTIESPDDERRTWETFRMSEGADTVVLDDQAWQYYRREGGKFELVDVVEHGLGFFPGAEFRISNYEGDRWGGSANQDLVDATLQIGVIQCTLSLVRRAQNKKLLMLIGQLQDAARQQGNYPDRAIQIQTSSPNAVRVDAVDFDISPKHFIEHIRFLYEQVVESRGVPVSNVNFDNGGGTADERLRISHSSLTEIRNAQIPFARKFEKDLAWKTVAMAGAMRHRLFVDLPRIDDVVDGFHITFPPLARQFNDPQTERDHIDWKISKGAMNPLDVLRDDPMESIDSLKERQKENLKLTAEWHEEVTKRNLSIDEDSSIRTAAQAFGSMGPEVRDAEKKPAPEGVEE